MLFLFCFALALAPLMMVLWSGVWLLTDRPHVAVRPVGLPDHSMPGQRGGKRRVA